MSEGCGEAVGLLAPSSREAASGLGRGTSHSHHCHASRTLSVDQSADRVQGAPGPGSRKRFMKHCSSFIEVPRANQTSECRGWDGKNSRARVPNSQSNLECIQGREEHELWNSNFAGGKNHPTVARSNGGFWKTCCASKYAPDLPPSHARLFQYNSQEGGR